MIVVSNFPFKNTLAMPIHQPMGGLALWLFLCCLSCSFAPRGEEPILHDPLHSYAYAAAWETALTLERHLVEIEISDPVTLVIGNGRISEQNGIIGRLGWAGVNELIKAWELRDPKAYDLRNAYLEPWEHLAHQIPFLLRSDPHGVFL